MGECDNVETLRAGDASPGELGLELRKDFEAGEIEDAIVITRDKEGFLNVQHNAADACDLGEMALYLTTFVQNMIWQDNQNPVLVDEGENEPEPD